MFITTKFRLLILCALTALCASASVNADLFGSAKPYPDPKGTLMLPDSLTPVMINHVGRHGARFPSGPSHTATIRRFLSAGTLTPSGQRLINIADSIDNTTEGRWGALDSLGMAEQAGIARRMVNRFPDIFRGEVRVQAVSSYVPRCVASMYSFLHEVATLHREAEITASSGPQYSPLMRFFSVNEIYKHWADTIDTDRILIAMPEFDIAEASIAKLFAQAPQSTPRERLKFLMAEYSTLAIQSASGGDALTWHEFLSPKEMEALWALNDVRQHLLHSASAQSLIPSAIAAPLLRDIAADFDAYVANPTTAVPVNLRFGHAETLMPLLALMQVPDCYYTGPTEEVPNHWHNYDIVPMAANLQMIMVRGQSGGYYVITLLNENPVRLPGLPLYAPWPQMREYLLEKII
ncbi:MAG: histidine-type phosphatase [Paramuribaculum sp.]|nr:histidine-type phosphatase [Paramuribaculum sp.]